MPGVGAVVSIHGSVSDFFYLIVFHLFIDKISIGVAGYPEGYTSLNNSNQDLAEVTQYLKKKVL